MNAINGQLISYSDSVDKCLEYGDKLLQREVSEAVGSDEVLPIGFLFSYILELNDAISVLIRHSCVEPCKPLLRSSLESFLGLEYILLDNTKKRALAFLVWQFHQEIKSLNKFIPGEQSHDVFASKWQSDKVIRETDKIPTSSKVQARKKVILNILEDDLYAEINQMYKDGLKKYKSNLKWYQILNNELSSLEQLAVYLERSGFYEVPYRRWSGLVHANDIVHRRLQVSVDGGFEMKPIRDASDVKSVAQWSINLLLYSYDLMVNTRLVRYRSEFDNWKAGKMFFNPLQKDGV